MDGGEPIHRYHIACYPFALDVSKIEGYDKLNEEDKQKVISRMLPHSYFIAFIACYKVGRAFFDAK